MNSWTWLREIVTRITSTYLSLREAARRPMDRGLSRREEGQGMVEYALILTLVAVVVLLILTTVGKQVKDVFSNVNSSLSGT
ncbi:MAG: Flp family type IVb pilin [Candidatus Dormibacteria bacterium]